MSMRIHIPQFNDDIIFTERWLTRGVSHNSDYLFAEPPVKFNAYNQVLPYRGSSDYNSGWVSFLTMGSPNNNLYYRIIYIAVDDVGWFEIAYESGGQYSGLAMKFDFLNGFDENDKYLMFTLRRNALDGPTTLTAPGPWSVSISQWGGSMGIGVWSTLNKYYVYTSNHVEYSPSDYYNVAGPWQPEFPQTQQSVENQDLYPGTILMIDYSMLYELNLTDRTSGFSVFYGDTWTPEQITNSDGQPAEPGSYDPNDNDPDGPSGPGGGDGDHRQPHDPVPIPSRPTIGPNSAGFVYMLSLTTAQMQNFAADLINPSMWQAFKNLFADPMDFMCGVMLVPFIPTSLHNVYPKYGENVFTHAYAQVANQYVDVDCGSLDITKYFGSCFDYNPYTELLVWLPYIGYRKLDTDQCQGRTVTIKYRCDCMTGDCVAFILISGNNLPNARVIAQYSGNCGVRVPYGANSYDAAVAASIQLLGGAVGAVAGGAMAGPAGIAAGEISASQIANSIQGSTVAAVMASKTISERSGVAGASAGYLSVQKPYLLRSVPRQSLPANYADIEGYPSNIAGPLSKCIGFAAVETIDLNGIAATSEEIAEIKTLLKGGVFI